MNLPVGCSRKAAPMPLCIQLRKGADVLYDGRAARVLAVCSPTRICLQITGTGETLWAKAGQISGYAKQGHVDEVLPRPASVIDEAQLKRANEWLDTFRGATIHGDLPRKTRQAIAEKMHVSTRTVLRHYVLYLEDPSAQGQLPSHPGPEKGSSYLSGARRAVITKAVEEIYESEERGSIRATTLRARELANAGGLKSPSYGTVRRQIRARDRWKSARKRHGRVRGDAMAGPAGQSLNAKKPLDFVQVDHAIVDLIVVDPVTREEIGRPWITLVIDVASRCILGFYLTFDPPSQTSVALALENACCPKDIWLEEIGYKGEWLPFGLMKRIGWDNAKCFHVANLVQACLAAGIKPIYRQVRHPTHGAYIERYIGTFMGHVHLLKGTTFSNTKDREDYPSQKKSVMSLPELILWIVHEINGIYHNQRHRSLGKTPLEYWNSAFSTSGGYEMPDYPSDRRAFRLSLLPGTFRRVTREGIARFAMHYWDDALVPLIGNEEKYWVAHDPRNISRIHLRLNDSYIDIPWRDRSQRPVARFEWERAKKALRIEHDQRGSEAEVFKHLAAQRDIEQTAETTTRSQRRDRARRPIDDRPPARVASALLDYSQPSVLLPDPLAPP